MATEREDRIRNRAYEMWEAEGRPQGRHDDHWHAASESVRDADKADPDPASEGTGPTPARDDLPLAEHPVQDPPSAPAKTVKTQTVRKTRTRKTAL